MQQSLAEFLAAGRHTIEKIDASCFQRVLGTDDQQAVALDMFFEELRAVPEVISRGPNIGAHSLFGQECGVLVLAVVV